MAVKTPYDKKFCTAMPKGDSRAPEAAIEDACLRLRRDPVFWFDQLHCHRNNKERAKHAIEQLRELGYHVEQIKNKG